VIDGKEKEDEPTAIQRGEAGVEKHHLVAQQHDAKSKPSLFKCDEFDVFEEVL
jgi:hypothetical protein